MLIANVSQSVRHEHETMSTLRFAQDAKCMRNHAHVNTDTQGSAQALKAELARLKADLLAKVCTPRNGCTIVSVVLWQLF
jgi:translation initiation factor IF-2